MMRSTGCRPIARASGTRYLPGVSWRVVAEETARALVALVLLVALCGALLEFWTGLS